jgi:phosphatidylglycerophosphate synthase
MPEPTNKLSSDYYLYNNLYNPIAKKICIIPPNLITALCGLLTIPIFYNFYKNQNMTIYLVLVIIRAILDSMDGAVARKCNTGSKLGALLDIGSDTLCVVSVGSLFLYKLYLIKENNKYNKYILILGGFILLYFIQSTIDEFIGKRNIDTMFKYNIGGFEIDRFIHDNVTLVTAIGYYLMKKYTSD